MANAPLVGWGAKSSRGDLGGVKTEIFFGKSEIRLDSPVNKPPDGQITTRQQEQILLVSRTRCSVLHAAPQSRDPFRRQARWAPDQQRTTPQRAARCAASGERRRTQHGPACPGRGAACFTLLRSAGIHSDAKHDGPRTSSAPRRRERRAAQHPENGGVPSTVPRVPDAVQRASRCAAAPGSIQTRSTMDPQSAAHHAGIARRRRA
jgi:hypothetical protein